MKFALNDTVAAIATGSGDSGIGIIRISGPCAFAVADKVFIPKSGIKPSQSKGYSIHYGWITSGHRRQDTIDEVLLTVMRSPRSYTCEDMVEINCHGGIIALRAVLEVVLENGCRLAQPGEFTKRAFLNGRIDLSQAESVLDIIRAKTDSALKVGITQLRGALSKQMHHARETLLEILSGIEANIDFPEEEIDTSVLKEASGRLQAIDKELVSILKNTRQGRIYREGIHAVICGKPNVGKSSLLNALLKQERSIVTPIAGTTRDTIEEIIDIKGIPVRIVDTAGIVEPSDLVEKKAVQRTQEQIDLADLILFVFDGSRKLSKEDHVLIRKLLSKKKIIIALINKIDAAQKIEKAEIRKKFNCAIEISAKKMKNISLLEESIAQLIYAGEVINPESVVASNLRHIHALKKAKQHVVEAIAAISNELSLEFVAQYIKDALGYIDEILGKNFSEDLLDKIFADFCIGK